MLMTETSSALVAMLPTTNAGGGSCFGDDAKKRAVAGWPRQPLPRFRYTSILWTHLWITCPQLPSKARRPAANACDPSSLVRHTVADATLMMVESHESWHGSSTIITGLPRAPP